jgi:hypothetical protein
MLSGVCWEPQILTSVSSSPAQTLRNGMTDLVCCFSVLDLSFTIEYTGMDCRVF